VGDVERLRGGELVGEGRGEGRVEGGRRGGRRIAGCWGGGQGWRGEGNGEYIGGK